ncbi:teicoplanin resistance protein VanZ [Salinigranum rubrum]|uniref:Teicoplanin resistance protein VanZ n=1 Tax=Salinigranum rubrum TaxID=755307 RepID=A0A2I8VLF8_9EURY|nr:VanZ family protein [Salinigranum rubrum]AUV82767.1 teicoplanin resistance protein VanZ [Salinigranum rubrum]
MTRRRPDDDRLRAVGVTLVLLVASLVPSPLERHPGWEWVGPDKLLHLLGHAGYVVVLADAFDGSRRSRGESAVLAVCVSTAHSLLTARLQTYVPGRMGETGDVVAGFVGAVVAASVWYRRVSPTRSVPER